MMIFPSGALQDSGTPSKSQQKNSTTTGKKCIYHYFHHIHYNSVDLRFAAFQLSGEVLYFFIFNPHYYLSSAMGKDSIQQAILSFGVDGFLVNYKRLISEMIHIPGTATVVTETSRCTNS